jgi:hypothetical protein
VPNIKDNPSLTSLSGMIAISLMGLISILSACGGPVSPAEILKTPAATDIPSTHNSYDTSSQIATASATKASATAVISTSTARPTSQASASPKPSVTPSSTATPGKAVLPAAIYFLAPGQSSEVDQIWRLERDGKTLRQISHQLEGISGLDVSPRDGQLAFTSGERLYLADPLGEQHQILFEATSSDTWQLDEGWLWTQELAGPRWSPDGSQLTVNQNGVWIIDPLENNSYKLIENHIPPPEQLAQIVIHQANEWSPNGERILVRQSYSSGHSWLSVNISDKSAGANFAWDVADVAWRNDNQHTFVGDWGRRGLWLADAILGDEVIFSAELDPQLLVGWPRESHDGHLFFFMGGGSGYTQEGQSIPLMLYQTSVDSMSEVQALHNQRHTIRQVLWAPNASFAVLHDLDGQLTLLPTDTRSGILLADLGNLSAWNFRWGFPEKDDWSLPPNPVFEATPAPSIDCPGTPASNLVIDDLAQVTYTDGRRLRVRAQAEINSDNILKELIEGTRFQIMDGPECVALPGHAATYLFWQILIPEYGIEGWAAEGAIEDGQEVYYIERWP